MPHGSAASAWPCFNPSTTAAAAVTYTQTQVQRTQARTCAHALPRTPHTLPHTPRTRAQSDSLDKLANVPTGLRLLAAIVAAVEAVAGAQAVPKLVVVLHAHEGQEEQLCRDLVDNSHMG